MTVMKEQPNRRFLSARCLTLLGSVALLGDTLHNAADALTAVPLGVAFLLARRRPTRGTRAGRV